MREKGYVTIIAVSTLALIMMSVWLMTNKVTNRLTNEVIESYAEMEDNIKTQAGLERVMVELSKNPEFEGELAYDDIGKTYFVEEVSRELTPVTSTNGEVVIKNNTILAIDVGEEPSYEVIRNGVSVGNVTSVHIDNPSMYGTYKVETECNLTFEKLTKREVKIKLDEQEWNVKINNYEPEFTGR